MGEFLRRLEEIFSAVAFADAGERDQAAQFVSGAAFARPALLDPESIP